MMNAKNNNPSEEIERTLSSLDGVGRAEAPAFFFSRLEARMARDQAPAERGPLAFLLRPAVSVSLLVFFVALNIVVLNTPGPAEPSPKQKSGYQQFAEEYDLGINTLYNP